MKSMRVTVVSGETTYVTEQNMVRNTDLLLVSVCPTVQNASGVPLPPSHNGAYSGLLLSLLTSSSSIKENYK